MQRLLGPYHAAGIRTKSTACTWRPCRPLWLVADASHCAQQPRLSVGQPSVEVATLPEDVKQKLLALGAIDGSVERIGVQVWAAALDALALDVEMRELNLASLLEDRSEHAKLPTTPPPVKAPPSQKLSSAARPWASVPPSAAAPPQPAVQRSALAAVTEPPVIAAAQMAKTAESSASVASAEVAMLERERARKAAVANALAEARAAAETIAALEAAEQAAALEAESQAAAMAAAVLQAKQQENTREAGTPTEAKAKAAPAIASRSVSAVKDAKPFGEPFEVGAWLSSAVGVQAAAVEEVEPQSRFKPLGAWLSSAIGVRPITVFADGPAAETKSTKTDADELERTKQALAAAEAEVVAQREAQARQAAAVEAWTRAAAEATAAQAWQRAIEQAASERALALSLATAKPFGEPIEVGAWLSSAVGVQVAAVEEIERQLRFKPVGARLSSAIGVRSITNFADGPAAETKSTKTDADAVALENPQAEARQRTAAEAWTRAAAEAAVAQEWQRAIAQADAAQVATLSQAVHSAEADITSVDASFERNKLALTEAEAKWHAASAKAVAIAVEQDLLRKAEEERAAEAAASASEASKRKINKWLADVNAAAAAAEERAQAELELARKASDKRETTFANATAEVEADAAVKRTSNAAMAGLSAVKAVAVSKARRLFADGGPSMFQTIRDRAAASAAARRSPEEQQQASLLAQARTRLQAERRAAVQTTQETSTAAESNREQQLISMRALAAAESTVAQADALSRALAAAKSAASKVRNGLRR